MKNLVVSFLVGMFIVAPVALAMHLAPWKAVSDLQYPVTLSLCAVIGVYIAWRNLGEEG